MQCDSRHWGQPLSCPLQGKGVPVMQTCLVPYSSTGSTRTQEARSSAPTEVAWRPTAPNHGGQPPQIQEGANPLPGPERTGNRRYYRPMNGRLVWAIGVISLGVPWAEPNDHNHFGSSRGSYWVPKGTFPALVGGVGFAMA